MIDALGGAAARGPASVFPHRAGQANALRAMGVTRDELAKMFGAIGYVNYLDSQMPDLGRRLLRGFIAAFEGSRAKVRSGSRVTFAQGLAD